jgi:hypothetical protein
MWNFSRCFALILHIFLRIFVFEEWKELLFSLELNELLSDIGFHSLSVITSDMSGFLSRRSLFVKFPQGEMFFLLPDYFIYVLNIKFFQTTLIFFLNELWQWLTSVKILKKVIVMKNISLKRLWLIKRIFLKTYNNWLSLISNRFWQVGLNNRWSFSVIYFPNQIQKKKQQLHLSQLFSFRF